MTLELVKASAGNATLETIKDMIPDFAKDIRLNWGSVLSPEGAPDLTPNQIFGVALATAYAVRNAYVTQALETASVGVVSDAEITAAKSAASIMAMNNIYYRFVHLAHDEDISKLPAKLRMNVIGQPGIAKADFELYSLAVSAINGCGMCIEAHTHELVKAGVSKLAIQSAIRIAAVIHAAARSIEI
jgi:alkyl hydroperoxide reductase subunit D